MLDVKTVTTDTIQILI